MPPKTQTGNNLSASVRRIQFWHALVIIALVVFGVRLFYLQVIKHDYYAAEALSDQLKQYEIPATRGSILAQNGNETVPIVLNQKLYTLYADPEFIKKPMEYAQLVSQVIGGNPGDYMERLQRPDTRYVVLGKRLSEAQHTAILSKKMPGLGTEPVQYRIYPQGKLASQLLGFVNAEGEGQYGIEQSLDSRLAGSPGQLKAITDIRGVPLAANKDNVQVPARAGEDIILSVDMAMQSHLEKIIAEQFVTTKSELLSAVILDPKTGKIKAMANYPTYDPNNLGDVDDVTVFQNAAVSYPIEPGSIIKSFTTAAALDQGVVEPNTSFYDKAALTVNKYTITNIEEDGGPRTQTVTSTLALSLNTGVVWELMQMGGGSINKQAITNWHNYMTNQFLFGKETGIEQGQEAEGIIPAPNMRQPAIELRYANTTFGQGMTTTAVQAAAALGAVVNGGTYYKPTLIEGSRSPDGTVTNQAPIVVKQNVVSSQTSKEMIPMMENVVNYYRDSGFSYLRFSDKYIVGGKTGTAQVALPTGGYAENDFNGTYLGFVGGNEPEYIICVFNHKPKIPGYAGSRAGQPVFAELAHMLINNGFVEPKQ